MTRGKPYQFTGHREVTLSASDVQWVLDFAIALGTIQESRHTRRVLIGSCGPQASLQVRLGIEGGAA